MKPGDIVLIRFPQTDLNKGKLRPALIIAVAPGPHADLLLALVTSQIHQAVSEFDEIIEPSDSDFPLSGLKVSSTVRIARLTTVDPSVVNARLGNISAKRLQQIRNRLAEWLKK